jgi:adhesin transport system membrane fusion protein
MSVPAHSSHDGPGRHRRPVSTAPRMLDLSGPDPAAALIRSPSALRGAAKLVALAFPVLLLLLIAVPWQQSSLGSGRVIALHPQERQQPVEAPVSGLVSRWLVSEGSFVKAGDPLVELRDVDPDLLPRLGAQRDAAGAEVGATEAQVTSYEARIEAAIARRGSAVAEVEGKIAALQRKRVGAVGDAEAARRQLDRVRTLNAEGLASNRDLELAIASEASKSASVAALDAELDAARQEREEVRASANASIASAQADLASAQAKLASTQKSLVDADVKLTRQQAQIVRAPRDGVVLSLHGGPEAGQIKAGDLLVTLVPETTDRAIELWIDGMDMPLVDPGGPVRVMFEGWPALQLVGPPGSGVGTFGGKVAFVDATDDGDGKFRVVVVPDPSEPAWPAAATLRQGVRAKGWLLFAQVPLGAELWRQINGFPPTREKQEKGPAVPSSKKPRAPSQLK